MNSALHHDPERFPTTRWTLLQQLEAQPRGSPGSQAALLQLRDLYWAPVLAAMEHVFGRGQYPTTDAAQLSREFFAWLSRDTVPLAAQHSGTNFRDQLKRSLRVRTPVSAFIRAGRWFHPMPPMECAQRV